MALGADTWTWQSRAVPELGFDLDQAQVLRVTSLASSGAGTLREALLSKGPRVIVFEVGGVIDLELKSIEFTESQVIIAGQTAPAPGITLIRGGLRIAASQCLVQHLSVRPGNGGADVHGTYQPDGITTTGGPVDVWIDHCSATWSLDENISAATFKSPTGEPAQRIVIRDCIIAEGLAQSGHAKGEHSKGTLVLDGTKQVAIVNDLYCSNTQRNPRFKADTSGVVVNNVIINPGNQVMMVGSSGEKGSDAPLPVLSIAGNAVRLGQDSTAKAHVFVQGKATAWINDNQTLDAKGQPFSATDAAFPKQAERPIWPQGLVASTPDAAREHVKRFVGARPAQRDAIDQRIIDSAFNGSAKIINSQTDVGGYPSYQPVSRALVVPTKNRREWLEKLALEVTTPTTP